MRRYQSVDQEREMLPSEYLEQCRVAYAGRLFAFMTRAGSALVEIAAIEDDFSISMVRCGRQHHDTVLTMPLSDFLAGLERGVFVACSR
jgi:hypothetical protein